MAANNRYNFTSVGGAMVDELTRVLAERRALQQQEFVNSLAQRRQALDEAQERRTADYQQQLFKDQAYNREATRAGNIYEDLAEGDVLAPEIADLLTRHGRGGGVQRGGALGQVGEARLNPDAINVNLQGQKLTPGQMVTLDAALTGSVDDLNPTQTKKTIAPGVIMETRGGPNWRNARQRAQELEQSARIAAESREAIARDNREAANQRAQDAANLRRDLATIAAGNKRAGDLTDTQFRRAQQLEADFTRDSKDFIERSNSFRTVLSASANPSAAGDLSLIFAYMKMLDPGSVVREGEFATAATAGSIPQRIWAQYNKVLSGERLAPEMRQDFVSQGRKIFDGARQNHTNIIDRYRKRAQAAGVPPEFVIADIGADIQAPQSPQQPLQPVSSHESSSGSGLPPGVTVKRRN